MKLTCIRAFGTSKPGDVVDVPDGAAFDRSHWTGTETPAAAVPATAAAGSSSTELAKELADAEATIAQLEKKEGA